MAEEEKEAATRGTYPINSSEAHNSQALEPRAGRSGLLEVEGEMPVIEEEGDEVDELMSQREYRQSCAGAPKDSGFKKADELRHPTRKLTITGNVVVRPERLLYKVEMPRSEFQQVIEIILMRICECLHKDINKSCFTLRMIFYKNLCGALEHLVAFLSQKFIWELFRYLVKPLN